LIPCSSVPYFYERSRIKLVAQPCSKLKTPDLGINRLYTDNIGERQSERERERHGEKSRESEQDTAIYTRTRVGERKEEERRGKTALVKNKKRFDDDAYVPEKFGRRVHSLCMRMRARARRIAIELPACAHSTMCRSEFSRMTSGKAATRAHLILLC